MHFWLCSFPISKHPRIPAATTSHLLSPPTFSWEGLLAWGLAWVDRLVGAAAVLTC